MPNPVSTPRIDAYRRFARATVTLERARREYAAALVQARGMGWPLKALARVSGVSERALGGRYQSCIDTGELSENAVFTKATREKHE